MLIKIQSVAEGKNTGKPYAKDILGRTFFPQNTDMELTAGHYAFAVETLQTKTYAEDGVTLVDLKDPVKILQITATFPTKAEAVEAAAEASTMGLEVAATVQKQAAALGLSDEAVKALAAAW